MLTVSVFSGRPVRVNSPCTVPLMRPFQIFLGISPHIPMLFKKYHLIVRQIDPARGGSVLADGPPGLHPVQSSLRVSSLLPGEVPLPPPFFPSD